MAKRTWIFLVYVIIALYIANIGFNIVKLPDFFINSLNKWVLLIAGVFIIIESFKYLRENYGTY